MKDVNAIQHGIDNLLENCLELEPGQSLSIIREPSDLDYYSPTLPDAIAARAAEAGVKVEMIFAPFNEATETLPNNIAAALEKSDKGLFLARIGDQVRFSTLMHRSDIAMCCALDEETFGTDFCGADYRFFLKLKRKVNEAVFDRKMITIRCREGTHLVGISPPTHVGDDTGDVGLKLFPMNIFRPVDASTFSGRIAISKWLSPTGSRFYEPASVLINGVVFANVRDGRIVSFEGDQNDVEKVESHYQFVAEKYNIDRSVIHSWHAGIHPQNGYAGLAADDLTRWSGSAFGNPRYLHLHSCGNYAPGEICISVFDPTITADDTVLWDKGRLSFADTPEIRELIRGYPGIAPLFDKPQHDFGLGEN